MLGLTHAGITTVHDLPVGLEQQSHKEGLQEAHNNKETERLMKKQNCSPFLISGDSFKGLLSGFGPSSPCAEGSRWPLETKALASGPNRRHEKGRSNKKWFCLQRDAVVV